MISNNSENLRVSAEIYFSLACSSGESYWMSHEPVAHFKIEATTGQARAQHRTSHSHEPSRRNSRRGTESNLNNPFSSGPLGWLMRCYTAALTLLCFRFFPITAYTHGGISRLSKCITPDISISITQCAATAICELTCIGQGGHLVQPFVRPFEKTTTGP